MKSILTAFDRCQERQLFCVGYAWEYPQHGEQEGQTVVEAINETRAMVKLMDQHKHLSRAWIIK